MRIFANRFQNKFGMTVLLLFLTLNLFSQTYQPTQQKLFYNNGLMSGLYFLDNHPDFQQKRYNIGWHWSQGYKMSQVLSSNQIHLFQSWQIGNFKIPLDDTSQYAMAHNVNIIINTPYLANHGEVPFQLSLAKALVYEPTYKVDFSYPHQTFLPRQFDTTRYAHGFTNVKGFISNSNSDAN